MWDATHYGFVIERLAEGEPLDFVASEFMREFKGVECTPQMLRKFTRGNLPPDWQDYYDICQKAFKAGALTSDREFMVAMLDKQFRLAVSRGAHELALEYGELIEKVKGGYFGGKGGGAAATVASDASATPVAAIEIIVVDPKPVSPEADTQ